MSRIKVLTNIILGLALLVPVGWAYAGDDEIPPPPAVAPLVEPTDTPVPYHYEVPEKLQDGWSVRDLRKEKADFQKINHEMELLVGNPWALMHSLLVFRHGRLILEKYFNGYTAASHQSLFSCTKSVFSTVYGIAQDQGLLSLDQKLYDLYPGQRSKAGWDSKKDPITIGNLLDMTSGLDCDDTGTVTTMCAAAMERSTDWLGFCFALPMAHPVGTTWMYNGCCLTLVSNLIAQKSGMSFPDFAKKNLLGPLGIEDSWVTGPGGLNRVDYGLSWTARDMGKLGQLYLNHGMWKGKKIISEEWIKDATTTHAPPGQAFGGNYGYLWYVMNLSWQGKPISVFKASGYQGQDIFVSPDMDLVCVMTAAGPDNRIYGLETDLFLNGIVGSFY